MNRTPFKMLDSNMTPVKIDQTPNKLAIKASSHQKPTKKDSPMKAVASKLDQKKPVIAPKQVKSSPIRKRTPSPLSESSEQEISEPRRS